MALQVIDGGIHTTVQDLGRFGYYDAGIPPSGPLDDLSFRAANWLVGNEENAAGLECTFTGPALEMTNDTLMAFTGANIEPRINGEPVPCWTSIAVRAGDQVSFGMCGAGCRLYIGVAGGIAVEPKFGSRSTYTASRIGGYAGRPLAAGDKVPIGEPGGTSRSLAGRTVPEDLRPVFPTAATLRTVEGLFRSRVTPESMKAFYDCSWKVTPEANRTGYRLEGIELDFVDRPQPFGAGSDPSNVVDAGYPIGSIQIPSGIEPIILLNDAVTAGGYATIGTVISADFWRVAQMKPFEVLQFVSVSISQALEARSAHQLLLARMYEAIVR